MEIFFAVNEAYTRQLCVAILSIAENNRNSPLNFHILSSNFPETSRHAVQKICTFYPNTTITFHTPDMKRFGDLKLNIAHISIETYFRYIIAEMLPSLFGSFPSVPQYAVLYNSTLSIVKLRCLPSVSEMIRR